METPVSSIETPAVAEAHSFLNFNTAMPQDHWEGREHRWPKADRPVWDGQLSKDATIQGLLDRFPGTLFYLFENGKVVGNSFLIGNVHGSEGKSLEVQLSGDKKGLWIDRADPGYKGDILDLWGARHGWHRKHNFPEIMRSAQEWLGFAARSLPQIPANTQKETLGNELERQQEAQAARLKAQVEWDNGRDVTGNPYLEQKKVGCHGIKEKGGNNSQRQLLVPARDIDGNLHTLQTIDERGGKFFLKGGVKKGHFHTIGELDAQKLCYVAEGYATAASVYEATGVPTICAFDAGNMEPVIEAIKGKYPGLSITIAADNDLWKGDDKNPGVDAASHCAKRFSGVNFAYPVFDKDDHLSSPTDFNDLHCLNGLEEVRRQISQAAQEDKTEELDAGAQPVSPLPGVEGAKKPDLDIFKFGSSDMFEGTPPEKKFLVEGFFPLSSACLFVATGGVGKGMLMLDLALNVSSTTSEQSAFGPTIREHGSIVIFSAEDDQDELHRRLCGMNLNRRRASFPPENKLLIIPLPNAGGPFPIIEEDRNGLRESEQCKKIRKQLSSIKNLKLVVFDPLASFVRADINRDPAAGAFLMGVLQNIATETGACVIAIHHTSKPPKDRGRTVEPETIEELFHSIRGTSALANGARAVYVMGIANAATQKNVFKSLNKQKQRNMVYIGGIGKANGIANWEQQIFFRSETGLLQNVTEQVNSQTTSADRLEKLMLEAVSHQEDKNAFTKTGKLGIFTRRHELPDELQSLSKHNLDNLAQSMLNKKILGQYAKMGEKNFGYLGVPGGLLSEGKVVCKKEQIIYEMALMPYFLEAIFQAERDGQPFNKQGSSAPWKHKGRLPVEFYGLSQQQLHQMTENAIEGKSVALCIHGQEKNAQWLCKPDGPLATDPDNYEFKKGKI